MGHEPVTSPGNGAFIPRGALKIVYARTSDLRLAPRGGNGAGTVSTDCLTTDSSASGLTH